MAPVVLRDLPNPAPDRIVGPVESSEEAGFYAEVQPGGLERYAVVEPLTPPST